jgi:tetratricopeptide (TPR) repeat protein
MMPWLAVLVLGSHGTTYLQISSHFKSEITKFHHHALKLLESPAGTMTAGSTWAELGFCAMTLGDKELAGEVFAKGLNYPTMFMRLERPRLLAGSALLALSENDPEGALKLAQEGLHYAQERGMRHMMSLTNRALGMALAALGRHEDALAVLNEAQENARALGMLPELWEAQMAAAEVLEKVGDFDGAQQKRDQAAAVVNAIAAGFTDETLRAAYLESKSHA